MNANDLYNAIGQADEKYLLHSERTVRRGKRTLLRGLLIAAVLTLTFSVSVAASPALQNALGLRIAQSRKAAVTVINDDALAIMAALRIEPNPEALQENAPETIETVYAPRALTAAWKPAVTRVVYTKDALLPENEHQVDMNFTREDADQTVFFTQYAVGGNTGKNAEIALSLGYGDEYTATSLLLGKTNVQCVSVPASSVTAENGAVLEAAAHCGYYWTDGSYLYAMDAEPPLSEEQLDAIVNSLAPVEDPTVYQPRAVVTGEPAHTPKTLYYPAYVPAGFAAVETGGENDGEKAWSWHGAETETALFLLQSETPGFEKLIALRFASLTEEARETKTKLNGGDVTVYETENAVCLVWRQDGYAFLLSAAPAAEGMLPELYRMLESIAPTVSDR